MHDITMTYWKSLNSKLIHSLKKPKYEIFIFKKKPFFYYKKFQIVFNENMDQFCILGKFRSVFNENIDQFFSEKISNLYLLKIQNCFCFRKISRSIFNENIDLFLFFCFLKSVMINCKFWN